MLIESHLQFDTTARDPRPQLFSGFFIRDVLPNDMTGRRR